MPIILVVDDSSVDRHLAGRLLTKEKNLDWVIEYAANGREAIDLMDDLIPDAIVTDMMMPELDGLELVSLVRQRHPQVPVILVTGQGSEELALKALEHGAASYVPKGQLADKLLDTVKQVLAVGHAECSFRRLSECFLKSQLTVELDSDPGLIAPLVDQAQKMLSAMDYSDSTERMHICIAFEEALLNAFCHGTLELPREQAQEVRQSLSEGLVPRGVVERRSQPFCRERKVFVDIQIERARASFVVRDQGSGFAQTFTPRPRDPKTLERGGGRGLVLMHNFMDEVRFNQSGNEVTMVKVRPRDASSRTGGWN
jgi:CheY-like chemotaxis protein/anti-sigma regulatory factor (Ser/Thr protein kinase)